jgi:Cof subfamily protein (haloacid dehalogenase superfamily)
MSSPDPLEPPAPPEPPAVSDDYGLFVVDLDGTLLRRDGSIAPEDVDAVRALRAAGVHVSIATGRMFQGTAPAARQLGLTGPVACVDGSHIVRVEDGHALHRHAIAGEHADALRTIVAEHEGSSATFVFTDQRIFHDAPGAPFSHYVKTWSPDVEEIERVASHACWEHEDGVLALVTVGPEATVHRMRDHLHERLGGVAQVLAFGIERLEGAWGMVVRAKREDGPNKGTGVRELARHHGLEPSQVVVVGDWLNDVPMFQVAGRSFAMRQAPPEVRKHATDSLAAKGRRGGGVAEAAHLAFPRVFGSTARHR